MNQAEEDALVEQSLIESTVQSDANVRFNLGDAIRLAIRAAVAAERERASKDVLDLCDAWQMEYGQETAFDAGMVSGLYTANKAIRGDFSSLPAAIRKGE